MSVALLLPLIATLNRPPPQDVPVWLTPVNQFVVENAGFALDLETDIECTFAIVGGADADRFSNGVGAVADFGPQDYDSPTDANADGVFEFTERAFNALDPTKYADRTFLVTLLDDPTDSTDFTIEGAYRANIAYDFNLHNNAALELTDALTLRSILDTGPKQNHGIQTSSSAQPRYNPASAINGLPALDLTFGEKRYMNLTRNLGRDIRTINVGEASAVNYIYYQINEAPGQPSGAAFNNASPHVYCLKVRPTELIWEVDGVKLPSIPIGPFYGDEAPAPGNFYMVGYVVQGGNSTAVIDRGTLFANWSDTISSNNGILFTRITYLENVLDEDDA